MKFEFKDAIKAIGYLIPPKDNKPINIVESGAYWQGADFSSVSPEEYGAIAGDNDEVGVWINPSGKSDGMRYFYGPIVDNFDIVPEGLATLEIPAAEYAVFTTKPVNLKTDFLSYADTIRQCWKDIFNDNKESILDHEIDSEKYCFELYSSKGEDFNIEAATVRILVPVKK